MDGVLVDNMRIHARAYDIFYERHGVGNRQNVLKEFSGLGNDEIMQRLFTPERLAELGGWQALSEEKEAIYRELYEPLIRPTAGLLDFLEALRREGIACAVGSSAEMRNIRFVFEKCGIESYFQTVVSSEQVTRCKPDPEIYLTAAAALGCLAYYVLYFFKSFAYDGLLLGGLTAPVAGAALLLKIPASLFNGAVAIIIAPPLCLALRKALQKTNIQMP